MRARLEIGLVHRLHEHRNRSLRHLVLQRRNAERSQRAVRLGVVVPPDRRCDIAPGLDPARQVQQVGLQVRLLLRCRHAVNPCRAILAHPPIRLPHPVKIQVAVQSREHLVRVIPRQFGYPPMLCVRVCGTHRFLQRFPPVVLSM